MRRRAAVAALLFAAAGACGEEDRTPFGYTPSADKTATSTDDRTPRVAPVTPPPPDTVIPPPPPATVAVSVLPAGSNALRATARLASTPGGAVAVSTRLTGGSPGSTYPGSVHQGVCSDIGAALGSLVPVTADSLGAGASASDLPLPLDSLTATPHVLVFGTGGRAEACGEIGAASAPPPAAPDTLPPDTLPERGGA